MARIPLTPPDSPNKPPLDPTAEHARTQLAHELAGQQYTAARPGVIDTIVQKIQDWLGSWLDQAGGAGVGAGNIIILIIVAVVIAAAIAGFFAFGVPRLNRRSASAGALFGDEDDRDSATLLRAAERAAASGNFSTAIEEGFRAIARGLAERSVVTTLPGTTAHGFALQAALAFPGFEARLEAAADSFDGVRYLGRDGSEKDWLALSGLESALRSTRPVLDLAVG